MKAFFLSTAIAATASTGALSAPMDHQKCIRELSGMYDARIAAVLMARKFQALAVDTRRVEGGETAIKMAGGLYEATVKHYDGLISAFSDVCESLRKE
ncbi:hypothetical protein NBRC116590_02710 [Pelagimonas sp. KU-00592-HH]|uniref:hypothetical protein n=1 Tax=Pelagimonas sp. KU-00592-HH TaxID=3127651 RepID=UPI0031057305